MVAIVIMKMLTEAFENVHGPAWSLFHEEIRQSVPKLYFFFFSSPEIPVVLERDTTAR